MRRLKPLVVVLASFALIALFGCERPNASSKTAVNISWTNLLSSTRSNLLYGSWEQAESCWANLKREGRMPANLEQWVQLQMDILTVTQPDGLKYELRVSAIQEMYWQKETSKQHLRWLKTNIETGGFREPTVAQKARELVDELKAEAGEP